MTNALNLSQHKHLVQTDQALRAICAYMVSQLIKTGVVDAETAVRDLEEIAERLSAEFGQRFGCPPTPNGALAEIIRTIKAMEEPAK